MYAVKPRDRGRRAFTLLEMTVALLLSSFVISAIFLFVQVNLDAVSAMSQNHREDSRLRGLEAFLQECLVQSPKPNELKLRGDNHQIGALPSDELTFRTKGGNSALSVNQTGIYQLRIRLKDGPDGVSTLGVERWHAEETAGIEPNFEQARPDVWIPLLTGVEGLNLQYFDRNQNDWIDEWNDLARLPRLVRMRLWTLDGQSESTFFIPPVNSQW
ncbi:MAG: prepilin-type N-terminal cleavage/methylation domain-containing protein [Verrucomicrobiota bacterium]